MRPDVLAETLATTIRGLVAPMSARVLSVDGDLTALTKSVGSLADTVTTLSARLAGLETREPVAGPPGPAGPAGPAGKDGNDGKDGSPGLRYCGVYVRGKTYDQGDLVTAGVGLVLPHDDDDSAGDVGRLVPDGATWARRARPEGGAMILVSLSVAKEALRLADSGRDPEFQAALEHASDVVFKRIDVRADPTWTDTTAPPVVQRATIVIMGLFLNNLGDTDDDRAAKTWAHVDEILKQTRDPAMA